LNGEDVVYSSDCGTSQAEFTATQKIMDKVNSYIEKPFFKNISRSACEELHLSDYLMDAIKNIIFNDNGSLKQSIKKVVLKRDNVARIMFENGTFDTKRDDKRWFVKFNPNSPGNNRKETSHLFV
jgi:hypothetical protein